MSLLANIEIWPRSLNNGWKSILPKWDDREHVAAQKCSRPFNSSTTASPVHTPPFHLNLKKKIHALNFSLDTLIYSILVQKFLPPILNFTPRAKWTTFWCTGPFLKFLLLLANIYTHIL